MWQPGKHPSSSPTSSPSRCGQHEILQLLLAAGADLGLANKAGETPMSLLGNLPPEITEVGNNSSC